MATVGEQVARLMSHWPREKMTAQRAADYRTLLADIPQDLLDDVVTELICTSEFFPSVRAIRTLAAERTLGLPSEADALAQVYRRIEWTGPPADAPTVDRIVRDAVSVVGGYYAFRTSENPAVVRGQFSRVYGEIREKAIRDVLAAPARQTIEPARPRAAIPEGDPA